MKPEESIKRITDIGRGSLASFLSFTKEGKIGALDDVDIDVIIEA